MCVWCSTGISTAKYYLRDSDWKCFDWSVVLSGGKAVAFGNSTLWNTSAVSAAIRCDNDGGAGARLDTEPAQYP